MRCELIRRISAVLPLVLHPAGALQSAIERQSGTALGAGQLETQHDLAGGAARNHQLPLHAGLPIFALFCSYCIWFEFRRNKQKREDAGPQDVVTSQKAVKVRMKEWDLVKFTLSFTVVWGHAHYLVYPGETTYVSYEWARWFYIWKMPAFSFISGVFGGSMKYDSISAMLCYTIGTTVMLSLATDALHLASFSVYGGDLHLSITKWGKVQEGWMSSIQYWYMFSLCAWRLTISPVFHAASMVKWVSARAHSATALLLVLVSLYFCRHWVHGIRAFLLTVVLTPDTFYLGSFFALGLLFKPQEWGGYFGDRRCQVAAAVLVTFWYAACLGDLAHFRHWNPWACLTSDGLHHDWSRCRDHYPHRTVNDHVSLDGFLFDLATVLVSAGISMLVITVLWLWASCLQAVAPHSAAFVGDCGSRTLYSYTCSQFLVQEIILGSVGEVFHAVPTVWRSFAVLAYAVVLHITLSSRGAEHALRWLVMPLWIRDAVHWIAGRISIVARKCSAVAWPKASC